MPEEFDKPSPGERILIDRFRRQVSYPRISVTDRCDLRCLYRLSEDKQSLPRASLLSLEEIVQIGRSFVDLGVGEIRIPGVETRAGFISPHSRNHTDHTGG